MGKPIKLWLAISSPLYPIFARLNKIPKRLGKFQRQILNNQNHIDINRLVKWQTDLIHQQVANHVANDGILVFKMIKIL